MPPDVTRMVTVLVPLFSDVRMWRAPLVTVVALPPLALTVIVPEPVGVTLRAVAAAGRVAVYVVVAEGRRRCQDRGTVDGNPLGDEAVGTAFGIYVCTTIPPLVIAAWGSVMVLVPGPSPIPLGQLV